MKTNPVQNLWNLGESAVRALSLGVVVLCLLASPDDSRAQTPTNAPPDRLSYQGYLADANGNALAPTTPVNYPVVFRIFANATGGLPLWSEQQIVTVDKGNFSVILGEGTQYLSEGRPPLGTVLANQANASDRYIGISVTVNGTPTDILPRLRLLPTPYAFLSTSARNLTSANGSNVITHANNRVEIAGNLFASGTIAGTFSGNGSGITSLSGAAFPQNLSGPRTFGGPVGIGNTSPGKLLAVGSASTPDSEGMIRLESRSGNSVAARRWDIGVPETDADTSGAGYSFVIDDTGTLKTDFMVKYGTGNVGIGTVTPGFPLTFPDVLGDKISLWGQSGVHYGFGIAPQTLQIHTATSGDDITFGYGSSGAMTETVRMKGNGNVGIGTTTPGFPLTFPNALGDKISLWGQSGDSFGFGIAPSTLQIHANNAASDIAFGYGSSGAMTEIMRIKGNGNVGIGTDAPGSALEVNGHITLGNSQWIQSKNSSGGTELVFWPRWANNATYLNYGSGGFYIRNNASSNTMFLATNGNVGIGTAAPGGALHIHRPSDPAILLTSNPYSWSIYQETSTDSILINRYGGGWFAVRNNGSTSSSSDARLKTNVQGLGHVLERALQLRPVSYQMKGETNAPTRHLGFIAQEVEPLFPEVVSEAKGFKGIAYAEFVTVAIGAIQELHQIIQKKDSALIALEEKAARVEALEIEVEALKKQVQSQTGVSLEARIRALEKALGNAAASFPNKD